MTKNSGKYRYIRKGLQLYCLVVTLLFIGQCAIMYTPVVSILARHLRVPTDKRPADVIVVLASGAYPQGTLSYFSVMRTFCGVELYNEHLADKIIFSGGNFPSNSLSFCIAEKMSAMAGQMGVPAEARIVECKSTSTYQNALEVKKIMEQQGFKNALLVTSAIHTRRAMQTFQHIGVTVYPVPAEEFESHVEDPIERLGMFKQVAREYVGHVYYKMKGRL